MSDGSLNEGLSTKGELNKYQGCVFWEFYPDICSQEQEEGILHNMSPLIFDLSHNCGETGDGFTAKCRHLKHEHMNPDQTARCRLTENELNLVAVKINFQLLWTKSLSIVVVLHVDFHEEHLSAGVR